MLVNYVHVTVLIFLILNNNLDILLAISATCTDIHVDAQYLNVEKHPEILENCLDLDNQKVCEKSRNNY